MTTDPMSAMIFAAGFGKRMLPLTQTKPKPLIKLAGKTLLDRAIDFAEDAGGSPVAVNTHYLGDQIEHHLADRDIHVIHEDPILETGGGLRNVLPVLGEKPLMTLNPDYGWLGPNPLASLRSHWRPEMRALLLVAPLSRCIARKAPGDFALDVSGLLNRKGDFAYTGAQIIDPSGLHDISETVFSLNLYWDRLMAEGGIHGLIYPGTWCDIGTPGGLTLAEKMLSSHVV